MNGADNPEDPAAAADNSEGPASGETQQQPGAEPLPLPTTAASVQQTQPAEPENEEQAAQRRFEEQQQQLFEQ